jgi:hypothetical protein
MTEVWVHPDMVAQFRAAFLEADLLRSLDPTTRVCAVVVHPFTSIEGGAEKLLPPPYPFCRTPKQCAGKGYCRNDPACNN